MSMRQRHEPASPGARGLRILCGGALALALCGGCRTAQLDAARAQFGRGQLDEAEAGLSQIAPDERDRVLFYMERGAIRQARNDHPGAAADYRAASDRLEALETYSLSKGAASLVINDSVQPFRGAPYERTLLHTMASLNHLSAGDRDLAAVEARRIVRSLEPEQRGSYPDDAASRWVAGLAFESIGDASNADMQYRLADKLQSGSPFPTTTNTPELVAILLLGDQRGIHPEFGFPPGPAPHVVIQWDGSVPVEGRLLTDTSQLAAETQRLEAVRKAAKTATRVVLKEAIAQSAEHSARNEAVGDLIRFVLYELEKPDIRRWETLPRWFFAIRAPCPPDLDSFTVTVIFPDEGSRGVPVPAPLQRYGNLRIAIFRDLPVR